MSTVAATGTTEAGTNAATTVLDSEKEKDLLSPPVADKKRRHLFSRGEKPKIDSNSDTASNTTATKAGDANGNGKTNEAGKPNDKDQFPPVPLLQLYRFSTKFELFTCVIGLFAAVCSGAAQVCTSDHASFRMISSTHATLL